MTKETITFFLGIILMIVPFLGVPEEWRHYTIAAIGFILVFIGYTLRRNFFLREIDRGNGERGTDSFVESTDSSLKE